MAAIDDLKAAATAASAELESITALILTSQAQIAALQATIAANPNSDPALEAIAASLNATLADVQSKLNPPAPAAPAPIQAS